MLTEYLNKESLEDLIRIEEEMKRYHVKKKIPLEGPNRIKIVDSLRSGKREI